MERYIIQEGKGAASVYMYTVYIIYIYCLFAQNAKIAKDAKETVQECVSEFIAFVTSEASDKCQAEKRKVRPQLTAPQERAPLKWLR